MWKTPLHVTPAALFDLSFNVVSAVWDAPSKTTMRKRTNFFILLLVSLLLCITQGYAQATSTEGLPSLPSCAVSGNVVSRARHTNLHGNSHISPIANPTILQLILAFIASNYCVVLPFYCFLTGRAMLTSDVGALLHERNQALKMPARGSGMYVCG
jgi:hypothetical protein